MNVKSAVAVAKQHVADLFGPEDVVNLALEEVEYDDTKDQWRITVGFTRSWEHDLAGGPFADFAVNPLRRTYKVVIVDKDGKPLSVKNREAADAE
jgi:hypothetical protein